MVSKHNAEVLSGILRHKKAVMCPIKEIHVLDKLYSVSTCSSAVSHEFHVNESTIYTK